MNDGAQIVEMTDTSFDPTIIPPEPVSLFQVQIAEIREQLQEMIATVDDLKATVDRICELTEIRE